VKTKSPAFQFYPADYLSDSNTIAFTAEQDGIYLRLLCLCWLEGYLPGNHDRIRRLLKDGASVDEECLQQVLNCFTFTTETGLFTHPRLEKERKKQFEWRKKSSAGGKASALIKRTLNGGNGASRVVQPLVNTMSSSSSSSSSSKKTTPEFDAWDMSMAKRLFNHCLRSVPSSKVPNYQEWANEFRLIRERDKRSKDDIYAILAWMLGDEFWSGQIRSPQKLRKHYETMFAKRNSERK